MQTIPQTNGPDRQTTRTPLLKHPLPASYRNSTDSFLVHSKASHRKTLSLFQPPIVVFTGRLPFSASGREVPSPYSVKKLPNQIRSPLKRSHQLSSMKVADLKVLISLNSLTLAYFLGLFPPGYRT